MEGPPPVAGWYGKLPALGDFASRRLPPAFIAPWDAWLQRGLAASRAMLGERWLDVYLNGPLWRFALLPGLCGPTGWLGTLMPSVDRVGRHFPLTLALEVPTAADALAAVGHATGWFAALEQAALACLDIRCQPEHLEARLAAWWPDGAAGALLLNLPGTAAAVIGSAAAIRLAQDAGPVSIWWREGTPAAGGRLLVFRGLPVERDFMLLLDDAQAGGAGPAG